MLDELNDDQQAAVALAPAKCAANAAPDEAALLLFCMQAGDRGAAESFFTRFGPLIRQHLRHLMSRPNPDDIEDLTSETFAEILCDVGSFAGGPGRSGLGWAYGIARNQFLIYKRRRRRRQRLVGVTNFSDLPQSEDREWGEDDPRTAVAASESREPAPFANLEAEEDRNTALALLQRLPKRLQDLAQAIFLDGQSAEDYSRQWDCNLWTVKKRVASCKRRLHRIYQEELCPQEGVDA